MYVKRSKTFIVLKLFSTEITIKVNLHQHNYHLSKLNAEFMLARTITNLKTNINDMFQSLKWYYIVHNNRQLSIKWQIVILRNYRLGHRIIFVKKKN